MAIIMEAGPIKAWWDENWNTAAHWHYALWRERVNAELVKSYYLVYRPHEAFQGSWDERAQSINDFVLRTADVIINLTPPGVPSLGTDGEILYAKNFGKIIIDAPPPAREEDFTKAIIELQQKLSGLQLNTKPVEQVPIISSWVPGQGTHLYQFVKDHSEHSFRFHWLDDNGSVHITDGDMPNAHIIKVEALA